MDVLTIVWGWIGGKKKGNVPPSTPPTPAHIVIGDAQLHSPELDDRLLQEVSVNDSGLYGILVSDE